MPFDRVNLRTHLERIRRKETTEKALLEEVEKILQEESVKDQNLRERVLKNDPHGPDHTNPLLFDLLESNRIFHRSQIKNICINFRLRFLNTRYYKGPLPQEVLFEIKEMEKAHGISLGNLHIVAPAAYFRLENADDPMLFAPIGNGYFYLIHQWGKDMHPFRKWTMWPLRNIENFMIFSFFTSFLLTFLIRDIFFARFQENSEFIILFLYTFKSVLALSFFYGISLGKNFSAGNWNSKYYN